MSLSKSQAQEFAKQGNSVWDILTAQLAERGQAQNRRQVSKEVWVSEKIGNLEIRGTDEFREKIKEAIKNGQKTPEFREAFEKVKNSEYLNIIEETQESHSQAVPNPKDPDSWLHSMNGKGTKAVIRINLYDAERGPIDDWGCKKSSLEVVLGHELGHAIDMNVGSHNYNPDGKIPPGEKTAMGIENAIRKDQGLPSRSNYNIHPETPEAPNCRPPVSSPEQGVSSYPRMTL